MEPYKSSYGFGGEYILFGFGLASYENDTVTVTWGNKSRYIQGLVNFLIFGIIIIFRHFKGKQI